MAATNPSGNEMEREEDEDEEESPFFPFLSLGWLQYLLTRFIVCLGR